jgi:hypothetical protein
MRKIIRALVYDTPIVSREKLLPGDQSVLKATGVLDLTHLRFFTYYTAQDLLEETRYLIKKSKIVGSTVLFTGILRKTFF